MTSAATVTALGPEPPCALPSERLLHMYRMMVLSRRLDERQVQLKQQQRTYFQMACSGHEALLVAVGATLEIGRDWIFPYYRDQALCLFLGARAADILLEAVGAGTAPYSGGRQMPNHWGMRELNVVSRSSATGMQFLQAVGCAEAGLYQAQLAAPIGEGAPQPEITCVLSGEGATSEGEFWEAINAASLRRVPVLFVVEDNGYAISVPVEAQTPGGNISTLLRAIPNLLIRTCDGTDPIDSYQVLAECAAHCRARRGPALVHASVVRLSSHSNSDDDRNYRSEQERQADRERDPIPRFRRRLIADVVASEETLAALEDAITSELAEATGQALIALPPQVDSISANIYSPDLDPTSSQFAAVAEEQGDPRTMVELINSCLHDEMAANDRIVVFGEDVADVTRDHLLRSVKGKGGVFKATTGLQRTFGSDRVWNSPIAEAAIVGRALGMALRGLKPVVEIQFFDYIWPAMMQIRDELANLRWRSNGNFKAPLVIRVPIGGYLNGGSVYHSQSGEVAFTHIPGLRVVMPSDAQDANGLLRTAIRCDDPVLFLEPKHLYRQLHNRSLNPGPNYTVPFGCAKVVRRGSDLTIVTYGSTVVRSVQASELLARESGVSIEILDLRSLSPYDWNAITQSIQKTNRVLIVHEDWVSWGYGSEIAARIASELFEYLDAPVRRVGARDMFCPYNPVLEDEVLPQVHHISSACRELLKY